jgi:GT2 family glycosyltransferase/glycosyltransferase involved in cell wall biosynthesis
MQAQDMISQEAAAADPAAALASRPADPADPGATSTITGYIDSCGPGSIVGWLIDKASPAERLEFDVLSDGVPVGHGVADMFRGDLLEAGLGDGKCAFNLLMPEALYDGVAHSVELRESRTGLVLPGCPRTVTCRYAIRGQVKLDGIAITGSSTLPDMSVNVEELELVEGGQVLGLGKGWYDTGQPGVVNFWLRLPSAAYDGRPHAFGIRCGKAGLMLGAIALVMPAQLTPEDALLSHAREGMKPALSSASGFRYESLLRQMKRLSGSSQAPVGKATAARWEETRRDMAQLVMAHDRLVRGFNEKDKDFAPLVFPAHASPRVSIVVPMHNKFHVSYHCLLSLLLAPNDASLEVILVDDGSSDATTQVPELVAGVQYLRNEDAQGFVRASNRGAAHAKGEYVVMLNNDTEVTAGWLDELLWVFEHFDGVGLAGAKLLNANGTLQEAGGIVWSSGNPWNYGRQANAHDPRFNYTRQADYLSGACVMLPRKLWNEIGGFSETYVPAYFEDTDLAFQVREKGYKTLYVPAAQVVHFEGISSGTNVSSGIKRFQEINRPKFKSRWIAACRNNGREGVNPDLNKDRFVDFRVLVIDADTPMPDQDAGSYAVIQEMRMLQALGFKCTFAPHNMAYMGRYTDRLQRMGVECVYAPFAANLNELLEKRGREFDVIYITRYNVAKHYLEAVRRHAPQVKLILNNVDLHFLRELRAAQFTRNEEDLARSLQTRESELGVMRQVDLVFSYTDVEKTVLVSHNVEADKVAKCPWVTDVATQVADHAARVDVGFLGGFNHPPNAEAVHWFVQKAMPLLRLRLPGVKFRVYGSHMPDSLLKLGREHDDVVVEGWVPDVAQVYNSCRVFVAPLQSGAGIKGKVIGAMAHGLPCVVSAVAAEGIPVTDGVEVAIAGRPDEWAAKVAALYNDAAAWHAMSRRALAFAGEQYGFAKGVLAMQAALQQGEIFTSSASQVLAFR